MRNFINAIATLVLTLLVIALILEGALRVAFYHSKDFSLEMWKYAVALKEPVANPKLSFQHRPNTHAYLMGQEFTISPQGFRDREFSQQKPSGTFRVMMLGDSTTLGWGDPQDQTTSKLLERDLNASPLPGYDHAEVINTGVGNYDTVQEVTFYQTRGIDFHPDVVVLVFFINDPEQVPREAKGFLIDRSYLIAYTANRFDGVLRRFGRRPDWKTYYAGLFDDGKPGMQACRQALLDLAQTTQADHTQLLVALLPELHQINTDYPFTAAHQKIKDIMAPEQVPVIDLIDGLRGHGPESTLWVTPLDDHPNVKANTLIASQIQDWIRQHLQAAQAPAPASTASGH